MSRVIKGEKGLKATYQDSFDKTIKCSCGGVAEHVFTYFEDNYDNSEDLICYSYNICNDCEDKELWPHDCCAIAVYICKKCLKVSAEFNQG